MTTLQLFHVKTFNDSFDDIYTLQCQIIEKESITKEKIKNLKELYSKLVKQNHTKRFLFCLDSLYFQYKTFSMELDNIQRYIVMINNRIYGDYYKLYHLILSETSLQDNDLDRFVLDSKQYTPYKDLEPFHEYETSEISGIHKKILHILNYLHIHFFKKEQSIDTYRESTTTGMSIDNFMQTLFYENTMNKEQLKLYVNYLTFFHKSQYKYLMKLFTRIQSFENEIDNEIISNTGQINSQEGMNAETISIDLEEKQKKKMILEETLAILESENEMNEVNNVEFEHPEYHCNGTQTELLIALDTNETDISCIVNEIVEEMVIKIDKEESFADNLTIMIEK